MDTVATSPAATRTPRGKSLVDDPIFTPLRFRSLTVKNRIFRSSISGQFDNEDGSLTQTRINWECAFAKGGVGAIISSYVPVLMRGPHHRWLRHHPPRRLHPALDEARRSGAQLRLPFIMQLSHSGRQMDLPGVTNQHRPALSSTTPQGVAARLSLPGHDAQARSTHVIDAFAQGALARRGGRPRRRRAACRERLPVHPVPELGDQRPQDDYGGSLDNRARFLLDVIAGDPRRGRAATSTCR